MATIQVAKFIRQFKGIGKPVSKKICLVLGYDPRIEIKHLTKNDLERIDILIRERVIVDKALNFLIKKNITSSKRIRSYTGRRHSLGLPTRGQRTHSNGCTSRKLAFYKEISSQKLTKNKR